MRKVEVNDSTYVRVRKHKPEGSGPWTFYAPPAHYPRVTLFDDYEVAKNKAKAAFIALDIYFVVLDVCSS